MSSLLFADWTKRLKTEVKSLRQEEKAEESEFAKGAVADDAPLTTDPDGISMRDGRRGS